MRSLQADAAASPVGPESGGAGPEYRNYRGGPLLDRVYRTYRLMHTHQTVEFVRKKRAQYGGCSLRKMAVMEALGLLDALVDESDPDVDFPNSYHAFQTAEGIRREHPDKDWFHLVGLLHDLGKVLALFGEPQWAVVGDTFPVGCKVQKSVVFWDSTFHDNPDTGDPRYRLSTWSASTPSTPGTRTGTTCTSAPRRTSACCPGCGSSTSSTSTPSRRSCPMCSSSAVTTSR
ncbi:inositol oxygenase isoform X2 [Strix aluco]|uniref:inositol oxygenase isoform X2 n=1 Tax=Strix aluco TaxID=111821 RepID=UPI003DA323EE